MLYKIKEKFWSLGDSFTITDKDDRECYLVKGKAFSWGNDLRMDSPDGKEVALIKQKLLSWKARYQIIIDEKVFAEVTKEMSWFKQKFLLDIPGPNDYTIEGSFWEHEFTFSRKNKTVATVTKNLWGWSDAYGVDIIEGEDDVAILSACIVIDQVLDDKNSSAAGASS